MRRGLSFIVAYQQRIAGAKQSLNLDLSHLDLEKFPYAASGIKGLRQLTIEGNFFHTFDYLKLCVNNGITFNVDKFQFCQKEVEFAGFQVTEDGVKPSQKILDDIANFPKPTTFKEAR